MFSVLTKGKCIVTVAPQIDFGVFEDTPKWRARDEYGNVLFYFIDDEYNCYEVDSMPDDYTEGKYFYDTEEGFVYNDAYIPFLSFDEKLDDAKLMADIIFVTMAENGDIDEVTASEHPYSFSCWQSNQSYHLGDLRQYKGVLYKCVTAHESQESWRPDVSPSLWLKTSDPAEEYPQWSQPICAEDAYLKDDKVSWMGKHWISAFDGANTWEPGVYGWEEVA